MIAEFSGSVPNPAMKQWQKFDLIKIELVEYLKYMGTLCFLEARFKTSVCTTN